MNIPPLRLFPFLAAPALLSGCVALAPVSFAWRSNAVQQYATTDARNSAPLRDAAVNADRRTETQAAVSTSSGSARTAAPPAAPSPEDTAP